MKNYQKLFVLGAVLVASFSVFNSAKSATLNQTSVSLSVGQSYTVYATNVVSNLYLTSNSVPSVASVSIVGNNINIYGSMAGSTVATLCDSTSACNTLYITVGNNGSTGTLSLSQTSVSLTTGQTTVVTAYNTYGSSAVLYVSSNSNSSVATATASGNTISIYGSSVGSSNITVCQSYNISCATIYVTVSGYGYNNYTNTTGLNISNLTLPAGSSATISSSNNNYGYNGTGLYVSSNSNPNIVSTGSGSGTIGCTVGALYSVVTGQPCGNSIYNNTNNYAYIPGCYAGAQYSVTTGQLCSSYGYGGVNGSVNGSITISAISPGSDTLTVCQSSGVNSCSTIYVTVTSYAVPLSTQYYPTGTYNSSGVPTIYSTTNAN